MGSPFKVVVTDYRVPSLAVEEEVLRKAGAVMVPAQCKTEDDVIAVAADADALLNGNASITARVIENLTRCRVITRFGIGYDSIDVEAATRHGIYVVNVPDYCLDEVSDHTVALILACNRRLFDAAANGKTDKWSLAAIKPLQRLKGQVLGLIGYGRIGRLVAYKARPHGLKILVFDPYLPDEVAQKEDVRKVSIEELLGESDYVSIHVALTRETRGLIGEKELHQMKRTAYLINCARGEIIDEGALEKALREKVIAGAAIDVISSEPPAPTNPLLSLPNLIITPHVAWYSEDAMVELHRRAAEEVVRVLRGERPLNPVNPTVIPRIIR